MSEFLEGFVDDLLGVPPKRNRFWNRHLQDSQNISILSYRIAPVVLKELKE